MTDEQTTSSEAWREIGGQFRVLGERLAAACRTAREHEETRKHVRDMQAGLKVMVNEVDQAIQEVSATPEAETVRDEVKKAAVSAREAGKQAWQEAQPHILSALRQVNTELQKVASHMEEKEAGTEPSTADAD